MEAFEKIGTQGISSEKRTALYRFLITKPDAVKTLIRHLSDEEGATMIACLSNADDRKCGRPTKVQRRQVDIEIEAILSA